MKHQTELMNITKEQADTVCVYRVVTKDYSGKKKPRPVR